MKKIIIKFDWDNPICENNMGHNLNEWGHSESE